MRWTELIDMQWLIDSGVESCRAVSWTALDYLSVSIQQVNLYFCTAQHSADRTAQQRRAQHRSERKANTNGEREVKKRADTCNVLMDRAHNWIGMERSAFINQQSSRRSHTRTSSLRLRNALITFVRSDWRRTQQHNTFYAAE